MPTAATVVLVSGRQGRNGALTGDAGRTTQRVCGLVVVSLSSSTTAVDLKFPLMSFSSVTAGFL